MISSLPFRLSRLEETTIFTPSIIVFTFSAGSPPSNRLLPKNQVGEILKQGLKRTDNRPIRRTRDPQRLTLHFPPTIQAQLCQPHPIHRIRVLIAPFPAQVEGIHEIRHRDGEVGSPESMSVQIWSQRSTIRQHGIERYPDAVYREARTVTQGVSSSAWFPMTNAPVLKYESSSDVGSKAWTFKKAFVGYGYWDHEARARRSIPNGVTPRRQECGSRVHFRTFNKLSFGFEGNL
jgi:hypothetical protein